VLWSLLLPRIAEKVELDLVEGLAQREDAGEDDEIAEIFLYMYDRVQGAQAKEYADRREEEAEPAAHHFCCM